MLFKVCVDIYITVRHTKISQLIFRYISVKWLGKAYHLLSSMNY